jgi:serine/threonine protein kinase
MAILPGKRLGPYEVLSQYWRRRDGRGYPPRSHRRNQGSPNLADKPELLDGLKREARTIASLNHSHTCTLYEIGHQYGIDFLVVKYLEGTQRLLKRPLPLPNSRVRN